MENNARDEDLMLRAFCEKRRTLCPSGIGKAHSFPP
jgi:hypothetical protein